MPERVARTVFGAVVEVSNSATIVFDVQSRTKGHPNEANCSLYCDLVVIFKTGDGVKIKRIINLATKHDTRLWKENRPDLALAIYEDKWLDENICAKISQFLLKHYKKGKVTKKDLVAFIDRLFDKDYV